MIRLGLILILFVLSTFVYSQESCESVVNVALERVGINCDITGRNELCYGYNNVTITSNSDTELAFSEPGDIVPITQVASIATKVSSEDIWGVALLKAQANIPNSIPGQNVTFVLFGNVSLDNKSPIGEAITAIVATTANLRDTPSTNSNIIGSAPASTEVLAVGRNADATWVYVQWEDSAGWIFADLLQMDDVMALADISGVQDVLRSMQAIYVNTGIGQATCGNLPPDGLLIQTPEIGETIRLTINDVRVLLGSTIFVEAVPNDRLTIYVIEGQAMVTAFDVNWTIPQGAFAHIPIDGDGRATGSPTPPEPYDESYLDTLPITLLDESIRVASPATTSRINFVNICRGTVIDAINVRKGPGINYGVEEEAERDEVFPVMAQAEGTDGETWYRLSAALDYWVRSDLIVLDETKCDNIPIIDDIPDPPASVITSSTSSNGSGSTTSVRSIRGPVSCNWFNADSEYVINEGQSIQISFGVGRWLDEGDAAHVMSLTSASVSASGVVGQQISKYGPSWHSGSGGVADGYGFDFIFQLDNLPVGRHTVSSTQNVPNDRLTVDGSTSPWTGSSSCIVIVQ